MELMARRWLRGARGAFSCAVLQGLQLLLKGFGFLWSTVGILHIPTVSKRVAPTMSTPNGEQVCRSCNGQFDISNAEQVWCSGAWLPDVVLVV